MAYQYPLNGGRINASISGNTAGAHTLVSSGTMVLSGGNNITLSQNGNTIGISAANAPSGSINFSAGTTSSNLNSIVFSNSGGVSFGLNGGTITGTVATNYAALNHSHGNPTLNLSNLSGTTASASNGMTLSLSAPQVSSLSATGALSLSADGNTISIGVPEQTAYSFANSNGVSFGTNDSTVTASVATNYAASNHSHGNPTLNLTNISGTTASNSGGLTLSLSAAAPGGGGAALSAGTQSANTGTINFANSNGITFGMSGNSQVTASHNAVTSQTAQTIGGYATGNTTGQSSLSTFDARSMSLSALGGASAGFSNGMLQVSAPPVSSLSGIGAVSLSSDSNMIYISAPAFSVGMSTLGNTAGTAGIASNQLILAGGNNITLSQSTGAGGNTITVSAAAQTAQTQSNIQGIIAGGSTNRTGDISFANSNGVTFGLSDNTLTASVAAGGGGGVALANSQTTYTSGSVNLIASGGVGINSTTGQGMVISAPQVSSLSATGALSLSTNSNTISIGVPAFSAGVSSNSTVSNQLILAAGNNITLSQSTNASGATISITGGAGAGNPVFSAGTASASLGSIVFSNSNGVSFGLNGSTITASGAGGGGGGIALANSQTTYTSGTANLNASGALTIASTTGQQLNFSVPATSLLSAGNGIALSTTGSTVVIGAEGGNGTASYFNPKDGYQWVGGQQGQASLHLQPLIAPNVAFDRIVMPIYFTGASNSTGSITMSAWVGIYTQSSATLSLLTSFSTANAITHSGTVNSSQNIGHRLYTMGATNSLSNGQYWVGIVSRTTSGGANATLSQMLVSQQSSSVFSGIWGEASNATAQLVPGLGVYSASTSGIPSNIAFSQLNGTATIVHRMPLYYFVSGTA